MAKIKQITISLGVGALGLMNSMSCFADSPASRCSPVGIGHPAPALQTWVDSLSQACQDPVSSEDRLSPNKRKQIVENARSYLSRAFKGKGFGYRLGSNGTNGYLDCGFLAQRIYSESGLNYENPGSQKLVQLEDAFDVIDNKQAKEGDLILFLKKLGNPTNHVGVVTEVQEGGGVAALISATERGLRALNRERQSFLPAPHENSPRDFQKKKDSGKVTWVILRWRKEP